MGPNTSFFMVIKNLMRDSPKVGYTRHLLSSSRPLKNKGVLTKHGGGEIERSGSSICFHWTWNLSALCHIVGVRSPQIHIILFGFIRRVTNSMFRHTFSFQSRVSWLSSLWVLVHVSLSQHHQVTCHATHNAQGKCQLCSTFWSTSIVSHARVLMSVHNAPFHIISSTCFVSMMGDTSWPSFEESFPSEPNTWFEN